MNKFINVLKSRLVLVAILVGMLSVPLHVLGQVAITGTVTEVSGETLPGVNVVVLGTTIGAISDINGAYSINVPNREATLVFSMVGYASQTVVVGISNTIDIVLLEDAEALEEVIVVGYGARRAGEITGSVAVVRSEDIQRQAAITEGEALRNVPGVTVLQSNTPGGGTTVRVRGMGTINDAAPLWVVDGVPGAPVNPDEIESITVLKDAAAQAIYGTRAANGVILVTTKSGRRNQRAQVTVNLRAGNLRGTNFYDLMNTQEYGEMLWLQARNSGVPEGQFSHPLYGSGPTPVIPDYIYPNAGVEGQVDHSLYNRIPPQAGGPGPVQLITRANKEGTDWLREISRVAWFQDYSINIAGGSDVTIYSLNFGYLNQQGQLYHTGFDRLSLRFNVRTDINRWVTFGGQLSGITSNTYGLQGNTGDNSAMALAYRLQPIIPMYDVMGYYAGTTVGGGTGNARNPMSYLELSKDNNRERIMTTGTVFANFNLFDGFQFVTRVSSQNNWYQFKDITYVAVEHSETGLNDILDLTHNRSTQWTWTNTATYTRRYDRHSFELMAGTEAMDNHFRETEASRTEYLSKDPNYIELSSGLVQQTNNSTVRSWALFSVFGRINYTYDQKYIIEGVIRRDGSSRFAEGHKYGVFPAGSARWVVSREQFMLPTRSWLDNLALRLGYGMTGNDRMGNYNSYSNFDASPGNANYMFSGVNTGLGTLGFRATTLGVTDVRWEETRTLNVGLDASVFRSLSFTFDVWQRRTVDMLFQRAVPRVEGNFTNPNVNVGEMLNRGFDLDIAYRGRALNNELNYRLNLNISRYRNEIVTLGTEDEFIQGGGIRSINYTRAMAGTAFPEFYGFEVEGIFQTQEEVNAHPVYGTYNRPGRFKYKDVNEDGVINQNDRTWIGSPHPWFVTGLNFNFEYKGFDLNGQLYASVGNKMINGMRRYTEFVLFDGNRSKDRLYSSWGSPYLNGDNSKAKLPMAEQDDTISQEPSTWFIEDASYLRLRNLQIGYNLGRHLNTPDIRSMRVFIQATNLFTITNYSGLDPEVNRDGVNMGLDVGAWPTPRQWMFGITVGL